jgi:fucose 4-O-acetylase-like acetyltransferase
LVLAAALGVLLATWRGNTGPFWFAHEVVIMAAGDHGNALMFPLTAIAGSLVVIFAAQVIGRSRALEWIGRNSLALLGIQSLFFYFVYPFAVAGIAQTVHLNWLGTLVASAVVALASLGAAVPLVALVDAPLGWAMYGRRTARRLAAALAD